MDWILKYQGALLAVVGIAVTVWAAIRFRDRKDPRYYYFTATRVTKTLDVPQDIGVTFRGSPVNRVSVTMLWFWNEGRQAIKRDDVAPTQPIVVTLVDGQSEEFQILDVAVRAVSRQAIGFVPTRSSPTSVAIDFAFLDYKDGAAIEIQHTGSPATTAHVSGIILGAHKGIRGGGVQSTTLQATKPPWVIDPSSRGRVLLKRVISSLVMVAVASAVVLFANRTRGEIVSTPYLMRTALHGLVTPVQVETAVDMIALTSRYRTLNPALAELIMFLVSIITIFVLYGLWRSPFPFPRTLALQDSSAPAA